MDQVPGSWSRRARCHRVGWQRRTVILFNLPIEIPAGIEHAGHGDRLIFLKYPEESQAVPYPELTILVLERPDRRMGWTARWEMSE